MPVGSQLMATAGLQRGSGQRVFYLETLLGVTVLGYSGQLVEIEAIAQAASALGSLWPGAAVAARALA